ncbi:MAG TPA: hypothetical protein VL463_20430 [Kofleriaceae bacterium]|jgi:hypothetical protein|nr:hypothetical protein [Kofleriaceae bacterium]
MVRIRTTLALACASLACFSQVAFAQGAKKPKDDKKPAPVEMDAPLPGDEPAAGSGAGSGSGSAGAAVEMTDDDKPSDDPSGTKENPSAPHVGDDDAPVGVGTSAPPPRMTGYPIEEVLRPITLPQNTSEVALDLRTAVDHADAEAVLRARYGITRQWQIGLVYNIGGVFSDAQPMPKNKFNTGKVAALEGAYLLTDWAAVKVRVPIYMQPFAMGISLGAPMKFRFGDKFAITAFDTVVDITTYNKFFPDLFSEAHNRAQVVEAMNNTVRRDGNLRFVGTAEYQVNPKTALLGSLGAVMADFGQNNQSAAYLLEGVLQWSPSPKLDLAGRLGFDSLADASSTFGIRLTAAWRI